MWSRRPAGYVILTEFSNGGDGKAIEGIENKVKAIQESFIFPGPQKEVFFSLGPYKKFSLRTECQVRSEEGGRT